MSRDAKNSLFATGFVAAFFSVIYLTEQSETGRLIWPAIVAVMFGLAKLYVLKSDGKNGGANG